MDLIQIYITYLLFAAYGFPAAIAILLILMKLMPGIGWTALKAKIRKRVLDLNINDSGSAQLRSGKALPEGGIRFSKDQVNFIPRAAEPWVNKRFIERTTGRPIFVSYSGRAVSVTPSMLAGLEMNAIEKSNPPLDVEDVPPQFKKFFEDWRLWEIVEEKIKEEGKKRARTVKRMVHRCILALDPRVLKHHITRMINPTQVTVCLRRERQIGAEMMGKQLLKMVLILTPLILVATLAFIMIYGVVFM